MFIDFSLCKFKTEHAILVFLIQPEIYVALSLPPQCFTKCKSWISGIINLCHFFTARIIMILFYDDILCRPPLKGF